MRRIIIFCFMMVVFMATDSSAEVPLPDPIQQALQKVSAIEEEITEFQEENIQAFQEIIEEGKKMGKNLKEKADKLKSLVNNIVSKYNQYKDLAKDPVGLATTLAGDIADSVNKASLAEDMKEEFVGKKYPTPEEFAKQMEKLHELERQYAANAYAAAFSRKIALYAEAKDKKSPPSMSSEKEILDAINAKLPDLNKRLSYVLGFESMSDSPVYLQVLSSFTIEGKEE